MLKPLGIVLRLDEQLVSVALLLSASLAQLTLSIDLVSEVHLEEIFLLLLSLQVLTDLVQSLLGAEVRLVVQTLNIVLICLAGLLLHDLIADEFDVRLVLLVPAGCLDAVHPVHVVHRRVELRLLVLSQPLHTLDLVVESL